jgi:zinc transport system substrate-binding protein
MKLRFPKMGIGIVSLAILFAATSGCGDAETARTVSDKPVVAVTIVPQKTFVEAVCGDLAEVVVLVPPGNSPENYEPTPETMEKFSEAAVYFTIGVPAETANILARAEEMQVVSLHEAAAAVYEERTFDEGERDPHVWLSPKRVKVMIDAIAEQMAALDPKNEAAYRQNAKAYQEQLDLLDGRIRDAFSGIRTGSLSYSPRVRLFGRRLRAYDVCVGRGRKGIDAAAPSGNDRFCKKRADPGGFLSGGDGQQPGGRFC